MSRKEMSPLGYYVWHTMDRKRLNYRKVARRSGGTIAHSTVSDLVNKPARDVSIETLKALARGLGEPEQDVIDAARGLTKEEGEEGPTAEELRDIEDLIAELRSWLEHAKPEDFSYIYLSIKVFIDRLKSHQSDYISKQKQAPPVRIVPKSKKRA